MSDRDRSIDLDLWLDDDWVIETLDGETVAFGRMTEYQDRVSLSKVLEANGYKIVRSSTGSDQS